MKKGLIYALLLATPFCLTGCGKEESKKESNVKTLTCTAEVSGMDAKITFKYDEKKEEFNSTSKMQYVMDLSDYDDDLLEQVEETDFCENMDIEYATSCNQNLEDKKLTITFEVDTEKLLEEEYDDLEEKTLDSLKEKLEEEDMTCSVK